MSAPTFVHLSLHTEYSLVDGLVRIAPLMEAVRAAGMPAVAVTEQCNLFSLVKFYRAAIAAGIKPIIGVDLWLVGTGGSDQLTRLTLLCQDDGGFRRLSRLVSRSYIEGQVQGVPTVRRRWLEGATDGLIALAGGTSGEIGRALLNGREADAARLAATWRALFPGRFYLDVARTGRDREEEHLCRSVGLALELDLPVVATNDVRFIDRGDFEAHEARVCIQEGRTLADPRRSRRYRELQYLRSPDEMGELFRDLPEAIENSVEIARRCNVELTLDTDVLPEFPIPPGRSLDEWFALQSREGTERRLAAAPPADRSLYEERLRHELEVISGMGFSGYFLIVADFIRWARENGIPVGPGRGSGAGSLVAYALGITDLDPIAYDLLFERFLNPERVSMPDFDIDFCMEGRDRVIDYVASRYGPERVAQIITFGTMAAKAVVRDVGRVLGHPYGFVDQIAKLIPFELGITLDKALAQEEALRRRYEEEEEVRSLIDLARGLEGLVRNAGRHAGGVVIAPSDLTDFTPLYREHAAAGTVTQLDKDDVAAVGLVKFDFLGLRTLTVIDRALRTVNAERARAGEPAIDIGQLPTGDEATFELIRSGATTAIFQLESRGMRDLIRRLEPDTFEDLIALVALFRPGPLQSGMVDDFIERKHGRAALVYPHPDLEPILRPTYGVILYQEQVMQIARVLAGYTLGGADLLRRAMGKKKPEEMAKQRAVFLDGSARRGVAARIANAIFDLMEHFAGYGFNRSHSAAYAMIAYHTAWLKAHHPAAFMAAALSADMDHTDKVVGLIEECRAMELTVARPDVNRCEYAFTVEHPRTICYGLGAIKGVGRSAIDSIVASREAAGEFTDLFDFCRRIDPRKVNRRALEAMIRAGALDALGSSRAALMHALTEAMAAGEKFVRDRSAGQDDLFGAAVADAESACPVAEPAEWSEEQRLQGEKETLGFYLSGHPFTRYEQELSGITTARLAALAEGMEGRQIVAGLVVALRTMNSRRGRMAIATIDDRTARVDLIVYSDLYRTHRATLVKDALLVAGGDVVLDDLSGSYTLVALDLYDLEGARAAFAKGLRIALDGEDRVQPFVDTLADTLEPFRAGATPVWIDYRRAGVTARLALGREWAVRPAEDLLCRLRELPGASSVALEY